MGTNLVHLTLAVTLTLETGIATSLSMYTNGCGHVVSDDGLHTLKSPNAI